MKSDLFELLPAIPDIRDTDELRFLCQLHGANIRRTLAMARELDREDDSISSAIAVNR
jgi:hypothetical protein